jgi:hypothetical protein
MKAFLLIFIFAHVAFGQAMLFISLRSGNFGFVGTFAEGVRFSWMAGLGDFDYTLIDDHDNYNRTVAWAVLFLCLFFNFVLMFNLLLSIIAETYTEVDDKNVEYQF